MLSFQPQQQAPTVILKHASRRYSMQRLPSHHTSTLDLPGRHLFLNSTTPAFDLSSPSPTQGFGLHHRSESGQLERPERCTPMRCIPLWCTPMRYTPVRCEPLTCTRREIHTREIHTSVVHTHKMHAAARLRGTLTWDTRPVDASP